MRLRLEKLTSRLCLPIRRLHLQLPKAFYQTARFCTTWAQKGWGDEKKVGAPAGI